MTTLAYTQGGAYTHRGRPRRICTKAADRSLHLRAVFCQCAGITYNKVVSKCCTPSCRLRLTRVLLVVYMLGKDIIKME